MARRKIGDLARRMAARTTKQKAVTRQRRQQYAKWRLKQAV